MKEYPQIELSQWTKVGEGFNGQAYVSDAHPGVMLKLVTGDLGSAPKVEQEFYAAQTAFEMGLPTPKVYEIVRNGKNHGYLCQIIEGKKSFARLCADAPDRIPEFAAMMAEYGKVLHNTPITPNEYKSAILFMQAINKSSYSKSGTIRRTVVNRCASVKEPHFFILEFSKLCECFTKKVNAINKIISTDATDIFIKFFIFCILFFLLISYSHFSSQTSYVSSCNGF